MCVSGVKVNIGCRLYIGGGDRGSIDPISYYQITYYRQLLLVVILLVVNIDFLNRMLSIKTENWHNTSVFLPTHRVATEYKKCAF